MLDRQIARRQWRLCQPDNLKQAKGRGVQDVASHKKWDIAVAEMVKSLGLSSAAQLPRRDRSRHPLFETSMAVHAAPRPAPEQAFGAGWTTSRPTFGRRWWPTT
jgi:hypothetical protein